MNVYKPTSTVSGLFLMTFPPVNPHSYSSRPTNTTRTYGHPTGLNSTGHRTSDVETSLVIWSLILNPLTTRSPSVPFPTLMGLSLLCCSCLLPSPILRSSWVKFSVRYKFTVGPVLPLTSHNTPEVLYRNRPVCRSKSQSPIVNTE